MTEVHPLCCDCCACLNGSGGFALPSAGITKPTPSDRAPRRRPLVNRRLSDVLREEEQARLRMYHLRGVIRELSAQGGGR